MDIRIGKLFLLEIILNNITGEEVRCGKMEEVAKALITKKKIQTISPWIFQRAGIASAAVVLVGMATDSKIVYFEEEEEEEE